MVVTITRTAQARRGVRALLAAALVLTASVASLIGGQAASAATGTKLIGTFALTPGSCAGGTASGTYLRMILPSGSPSGPYMSNSDSRCGDQSFTPLNPGTDGGLYSGSYQPQPTPPFDSKGNAQAGTITAPAPFYGTAFATSANKVDPQTHLSVNAPIVTLTGSTLHADLRSFAVTWNSQYFNQGSPKPDGSYPGNTRPATGTYNASTGAFTLNWTSQVVGGPFNNFTGQWHLQGVFHAAGGHSVGAGSGGHASSAPTHAGSAPAGTVITGASTVPASTVPTGSATPSSSSSGAVVAGGRPRRRVVLPNVRHRSPTQARRSPTPPGTSTAGCSPCSS